MVDQSNIIYPPDSVSNPSFPRHDSILTVADLKTRYLHGVVLTDAVGEPLSDVAYQTYIAGAISDFEHEYGVPICPTQFVKEPHDYNLQDYQNYSFISLRWKPIISVELVAVQFIKNENLLEFPEEWIRIYREPGQLHVTPTSAGISNFNMSGSGFLPQIFGVRQRYPQLLVVTYTAGFEANKIPWIVNQYIGMKAAIQALAIAGDLVLGAGITSQSLSIDGLSQNIGSSKSADGAAYSARIKLYDKQLTEDIKPTLAKFYRGLNFRIS